jgi:hypothetical protein
VSKAAILYRRYLEACLEDYGSDDDWWTTRQAWLAMPLWLRVKLCWECGWGDAVTELYPPLGRFLYVARCRRQWMKDS